jgi:pantoate--beta-alanine ligase
MKVFESAELLRRWRNRQKGRVVLVPTMGALHHGHEALIQLANRRAGPHGVVVVTIFVNPSQFGPNEDYDAYPRPLRHDLAVCRAAGADAVFHPPPGAMYPDGFSTFVEEVSLSRTLCGKSRPGHFRGVCTIVAKLFLLAQPTHAVFGEKDWQQLQIIRAMVRDLGFPVSIVPCPTVREADGLAASSRNAYLDTGERRHAPAIHRALLEAARLGSPATIVRKATALIRRIPGARIDHIAAVDSLLKPLRNRQVEGRLLAAVFLGKTRLIDNIPLPPLP